MSKRNEREGPIVAKSVEEVRDLKPKIKKIQEKIQANLEKIRKAPEAAESLMLDLENKKLKAQVINLKTRRINVRSD